mmetsp:Transcript_2277/g.3798  ORF Transcript_2277/g.3798 Transcript_2277/m.3798 type:complete len:206 (+) Transcript_2277:273-890(+)
MSCTIAEKRYLGQVAWFRSFHFIVEHVKLFFFRLCCFLCLTRVLRYVCKKASCLGLVLVAAGILAFLSCRPAAAAVALLRFSTVGRQRAFRPHIVLLLWLARGTWGFNAMQLSNFREVEKPIWNWLIAIDHEFVKCRGQGSIACFHVKTGHVKCRRQSPVTGTTSSSNAMYIVFFLCRKIKVDNMHDVTDVQSPRCDVCGNENPG